MHEQGAADITIKTGLRHSDLRMTDKYVHPAEKFMREEVKRLEAVFPAALADRFLPAPDRDSLVTTQMSPKRKPRKFLILLASPTGFEPVLPP